MCSRRLNQYQPHISSWKNKTPFMNDHILKKNFRNFGTCLLFLTSTLTIQAMENLNMGKIKPSNGEIASTWINTTDHKTYISGTVRPYLPIAPTIGAHVHVELLGKNGELIQCRTDRLSSVSQRKRSSSQDHSYVVSFPVEEARKASRVRVSYFNKSHTRCDTCREPGAG
jgi:hypothetical protein